MPHPCRVTWDEHCTAAKYNNPSAESGQAQRACGPCAGGAGRLQSHYLSEAVWWCQHEEATAGSYLSGHSAGSDTVNGEVRCAPSQW